MKILITGGTGFVGSYIVKVLLADNHEVAVVTRDVKNARLLQDHPKLSFHSLADNGISEAFSGTKINAIIHLATAYGRDGDVENVFRTNLLFPMELLSLAKEHSVKRFINTDSFSSLNVGLDYLQAYHKSKRDFYNWGQMLATDSDLEFVTFFLQHPYGPGDSDSKFVSFIIDKMLSEKDYIDLTAGAQKRDFIHVSDVAEAYRKCIVANALEDDVFEVGCGQSTSIKQFVTQVKELSGNRSVDLRFGALPTRANEIMESVADTEALKKLNWAPTIKLKDGLAELIELKRSALGLTS